MNHIPLFLLKWRFKMRPTLHETFMSIAYVMSARSTCPRRMVGAVIVDNNNYILSAGYNGQPAGFEHCIDKNCLGANCASGQGLELCEALHAEQNAIARLKEPFNAKAIYCTTAPCVACTKLILATSIEHVYICDNHPGSGNELFKKAKGHGFAFIK